MSVSLHRVLDSVRAGRLPYYSKVEEAQLESVSIFLQREGKNAQCFDLGDAAGFSDFKVIPELVRLPFEACWFEFGREIRYGVLMAHAEYDFEQKQHASTPHFYGAVFTGNEQAGLGFAGAFMVGRENDAWKIWADPTLSVPVSGEESEGEANRLASIILQVIFRFLSALHCKNVIRIEHKPDPAHQKRRAKQGRAPLFSYWTLHLDLSSSAHERADQGGTHASPRLHLRRGHPRQFKPGEWTWVQPHVVGSKHGLVHKDYAVKVF